MPTLRTIVPRYKKNSSKVADIMTFNIERLAYPGGDRNLPATRTLDPVTITPQGTKVSESDAAFILSTSQRIELVADVNFSRMNKDALLAELVRRRIHIPDGRPTNAALIDLLEHPPVDEAESEEGVQPNDPPPGDDD